MNTENETRDHWLDLPPNLPKHNGAPMLQYSEPEPETRSEVLRIRLETAAAILHYLGTDGKAADVGRRTLLIAYLAGQLRCTRKELAGRLGRSSGYTSRAIKEQQRNLSKIIQMP